MRREGIGRYCSYTDLEILARYDINWIKNYRLGDTALVAILTMYLAKNVYFLD